MTDEQLEEKILVYPITVSFKMRLYSYVKQLKSEKQLAETQLKELLSALYKLTDNVWQAYELCRDDVLKLAKDYGIKEEELNGKQ